MTAPPTRPAERPRWLAVAALLLAAALLRVATLFYHEISGDDATVALMARHALVGENFPVFFYRQTYVGALTGYHLVPALFLFGPSVLLVRLHEVLWNLPFLLGLYLLVRRLYGEPAGLAALALGAVSPFLLTYWSSVAEPHFTTNTVAVLLLLLALFAHSDAIAEIAMPATEAAHVRVTLTLPDVEGRASIHGVCVRSLPRS